VNGVLLGIVDNSIWPKSFQKPGHRGPKPACKIPL
jgi:hypothetical protein